MRSNVPQTAPLANLPLPPSSSSTTHPLSIGPSVCPSVHPTSFPFLLPSPSVGEGGPPSPSFLPPCPVSIPAVPAVAPVPTAVAPITMAPGLQHPRRWNLPGCRGWCRRGRAAGAATGGTRRQTGNEHRPSPLLARADGSPRLRGRRGAREGTEVTWGRDRGGRHRPLAPHPVPQPCVGLGCSWSGKRGGKGGAQLRGWQVPSSRGTLLGQESCGVCVPLGWGPVGRASPWGRLTSRTRGGIPLGSVFPRDKHPVGVGIPSG